MDPVLMLFGQHPRDDWQWTLDPGVRTWRRGNALALANCSLLAYSDQSQIDRQLRSRGFNLVIACDSDHHSSDTQAYAAVRSDAVIVAFRGTEPTSLRDFTTDLDARLVPFETKFQFSGWGQVHEGWADGATVVLKKVADALAAHAHGAGSVWITGHSLGGALAMVTAAVLANVPDHPIGGVYTFGQPRVGDPAFRARYDKALGGMTFRCVNDRDLVPHVPPRELTKTEQVLARPSVHNIAELADALVHRTESPDRYEHAGQLRLLLPNGGLSDKLADESAREPDFLARPRTARSLVVELSRLLIASPELLKDHAPINRITHDGYVERIEALP
jgi:triacylglycerol lipase